VVAVAVVEVEVVVVVVVVVVGVVEEEKKEEKEEEGRKWRVAREWRGRGTLTTSRRRPCHTRKMSPPASPRVTHS